MEATQHTSGINHSSKTTALHDNPVRALVVDDDRTTRLMLQAQMEEFGHEVITAHDGKEAWKTLQQEKDKLDVVLLDREMPEMNGLEVVALMKDDPVLKYIPVIMQTGSDRPEQIKQGIDAGVYYYLTKPIDEEILKSVLSAAVREVRQQKVLGTELKQHKTSFNLIDTCKFHFHSLPEAESLACFIANFYKDAERVVSGLAELLINAVEHGSLGIGYKEKTWLLDEGTWRNELIRRADLPEHKGKRVEVILQRKEKGVFVRIRDSGKGFEWRKYMDIDPARAQDNHGRGIAQANAISFDRIIYNDTGNEVTAFVSNEPELDW